MGWRRPPRSHLLSGMNSASCCRPALGSYFTKPHRRVWHGTSDSGPEWRRIARLRFIYQPFAPHLDTTIITHLGASTPPDLATSFTDGFGMNQSPTYVPLTNSTYYDKYSTAAYPEADYGRHCTLSVNSAHPTERYDLSGSTVLLRARAQVQGRGFEGFYAKRAFEVETLSIRTTITGRHFLTPA